MYYLMKITQIFIVYRSHVVFYLSLIISSSTGQRWISREIIKLVPKMASCLLGTCSNLPQSKICQLDKKNMMTSQLLPQMLQQRFQYNVPSTELKFIELVWCSLVLVYTSMLYSFELAHIIFTSVSPGIRKLTYSYGPIIYFCRRQRYHFSDDIRDIDGIRLSYLS